MVAQAHQPSITENNETLLTNPEVSKAYYGKLNGSPEDYIINATKSFDLYINVLVPDIEGQKKDISAIIFKDGEQLAFLNGQQYKWEKFYEPFGADTYWKGPEFKARAEAGKYEISVQSTNNDSKYSLAVGEIEKFGRVEGIDALRTIPQLKKDFFEESPITFIKSPLGIGYIIVMYLLAFIVGYFYRLIVKKYVKRKTKGGNKNIGKRDRRIRLMIAVVLLLWAITTSWSPILLFFSGFSLFEAIFSWCAFYAALGKNSCPM